MIIPAIAEALKGTYPSGSTMAGSVARKAALTEISNAVGTAIYWLRQPEPRGHSAIMLRVLSKTPEYTLASELATVQPIIQLDVFTKGQPPIVCLNLADACRRALSNYRGLLQHPDASTVYVRGATVLREPTDPAQLPTGHGAYWAFASGFDIQVTYDRTVVT